MEEKKSVLFSGDMMVYIEKESTKNPPRSSEVSNVEGYKRNT